MTGKEPAILNRGYVHIQRKNAMTMNNIVNHFKEADRLEKYCWVCVKKRSASSCRGSNSTTEKN